MQVLIKPTATATSRHRPIIAQPFTPLCSAKPALPPLIIYYAYNASCSLSGKLHFVTQCPTYLPARVPRLRLSWRGAFPRLRQFTSTRCQRPTPRYSNVSNIGLGLRTSPSLGKPSALGNTRGSKLPRHTAYLICGSHHRFGRALKG